MSERNDRQPGEAPMRKPYARPKLTEYGSVAKLTMFKGSTAFESPTAKKQGACL